METIINSQETVLTEATQPEAEAPKKKRGRPSKADIAARENTPEVAELASTEPVESVVTPEATEEISQSETPAKEKEITEAPKDTSRKKGNKPAKKSKEEAPPVNSAMADALGGALVGVKAPSKASKTPKPKQEPLPKTNQVVKGEGSLKSVDNQRKTHKPTKDGKKGNIRVVLHEDGPSEEARQYVVDGVRQVLIRTIEFFEPGRSLITPLVDLGGLLADNERFVFEATDKVFMHGKTYFNTEEVTFTRGDFEMAIILQGVIADVSRTRFMMRNMSDVVVHVTGVKRLHKHLLGVLMGAPFSDVEFASYTSEKRLTDNGKVKRIPQHHLNLSNADSAKPKVD